MNTTLPFSQTMLKRQVALPQDHGSWVFLISPLLIGLFAGGAFNTASLALVLAAFAGFLIRQPLTILTKILSKRRARSEWNAAIFWASVYAVLGLLAVGWLVALGHAYVLVLALPGVPVFAWHLALVSRRAERRQAGIELIATGVLALAAPAAYWVGLGHANQFGWVLWLLVWAQSAASIVYAYLRLEQRGWPDTPPLAERLRQGRGALAFAAANFAGALAIAAGAGAFALALPFAIQLAETVWGTLVQPAVHWKPTKIGVRQLIVSSLFTLAFIAALLLSPGL